MDKGQITTAAGLLAELTTEINRHTYGIRSYEKPVIKDSKAQTKLILLNDVLISVTLTRSGYTATRVSDAKLEKFMDTPFETLTALLSALSPAFNSAMHQALSARLMAIAAAQQDEDEGDTSDRSHDAPVSTRHT